MDDEERFRLRRMHDDQGRRWIMENNKDPGIDWILMILTGVVMFLSRRIR